MNRAKKPVLIVVFFATLQLCSSLQAQTSPTVKPLPMSGWPQWGGTSHRNNVSPATNIPVVFDIKSGLNVRWIAQLGSLTNNSPVVYGERVFIGTNNRGDRIERFAGRDMAVMLCFDQNEGSFLWQFSSDRLEGGRAVDWPEFGMGSMPYVEDDRMWFLSNRCEVVCLDVEGFRDGENDGPYRDEENQSENEADIVWRYDLIGKHNVHPHNLTTSSPTCAGDLLLLNTGNGVDLHHLKPASPDAPSFVAINCENGELVWTDASPGANIMHAQWSSPAFGVFDGVPQAIFAGGDGWLYSFDIQEMRKGITKLLWEFDCNPKKSVFRIGGQGDRNTLPATPMIYNNRVYIGTGQDPEHGSGKAMFYCIDPTRRGDISSQLVFDDQSPDKPIPFKLPQACDESQGNFVRENPNSGLIWQFDSHDLNSNGRIDNSEQMHRTLSTAVAADGLVYIASTDGYVQCLDADTGELYWSHDTFAEVVGSPMIADGKLIVGTNEATVLFLECGDELKVLSEVELERSVNSTPTAFQETLYIADRGQLFAIGKTE